MKVTRALLIVLACTGWAGAAHAVALGEINVTSHLNQALVATIPVATNKPGELEGATVELASNEEFDRSGLERTEFLSTLRFEIKDGYIKVTSKEIVREPFVTFLVDIRWIGGHLLREYTVLLDLPTTGSSAAPRARAVETPPPPAANTDVTSAGAAPAESQMAPVESASPAPAASVQPAPVATSSGGTYGPTQPQETLWSIAYKLRPDLSLTMDQVQVAIFNANPQAFDHGRINGLMKNQTLRVPTTDEIRAVDPVAAKSIVANARNGGSPAPAPAARAAKPAKAKPEPKAEAATVVPEPTPEPQVAQAPPPSAEPKPEPAAPAPSSVPPPQSTLSQAPPSEPAATPAPDAKSEPVAPPAETPPASAEAPKTEPVAAPAPAKVQTGSVMGDVMDRGKELLAKPWFIPAAAGFVLLLALVFGFNKLRDQYAKWAYERAAQKAAAPKAAPAAPVGDYDATQVAGGEPEDYGAPQHDAVTQIAPNPSAQVAATQVLAAQTLQQTLQATGSQGFQSTVQQTQIVEAPQAQTGGQKVDFDVTGNFANETVQINLDAGDPVSEAEFHRAYGLYDEAALLLKQALQKDPKRTDARVKLAEIYFEASKSAEFVETARELKGQLPDAEWQKIALLGTQIAPGNDLFAGGGASATGTVDLSFDEPSVAPDAGAAAPAQAPAQAAGDSLEFDLGSLSLDTPAAPAQAPAAAPAAPAGDSLEFDLGSLSLDTPAATPAAPAETPAAADLGGELNLADFDLGADAAAPAASPIDAPSDGSEALDLSGDLTVDPGAGGDESSTKLDLARAYIDMGDNDMAKSLLGEVVAQGNPQQKNEAQELLKRVPG